MTSRARGATGHAVQRAACPHYGLLSDDTLLMLLQVLESYRLPRAEVASRPRAKPETFLRN